ncbi:MAG: hypothetical protein ACO25B_06885 [Chitinophagaceae bacterium]
MKKPLFIVAALVFFASCKDKKDKEAMEPAKYSDIAAENLKGDIVSYTETPYQTDSAGVAGDMDSCCISMAEFDNNGYIIRSTSKNSKGEVTQSSTYTRHPNGLWKGAENTKDGKTTGGMETELDDKGNYTVARETDSTGKMSIYYTDITTNEYGNVTHWKQYDQDSVFRQEGMSTYDKTRQLSFELKDSTGKVKSSSASKYNDKGEMTENSYTTTSGDTTKTTVTMYTYESYDDMGNWTQRTSWEDGKAKKVVKRTYEYRKEGEK